jgi:ATP-dependent DNA helicase RecG
MPQNLELKGIGPERARRLEASFGVRSIGDLLFIYPRSYLELGAARPIGSLTPGERAVVVGKVERTSIFRGRVAVVSAYVRDDSGTIRAVWFNQPFLKRSLGAGDRLLLSGDVVDERGLQLRVREFETLAGGEPELIPIYPSAEGIPRKWLRTVVHRALEILPEAPESLPEETIARHNLAPLPEALRSIHRPASRGEFERARRRLAFDELFLMQLALSMSRARRRRERVERPLKRWPALDLRIRSLIPFELTAAQKRAAEEIARDLTSDRPMNRLLQGDVGSGKTAVALIAALIAVGNRRQACILAPTEVLALQHGRTFSRILSTAKVRMEVLAGENLKPAKRRALLARIEAGEVDLAVGTHALLEPDVRFKDLALAVIDEQHKFGVSQRAALLAKGRGVHALVMTATPIPRTLTVAAYGDLDVSVLDAMPPGRIPPRTFLRPPEKLPEVLDFIRGQFREGHQAFFIYPIVDESDRLVQIRSATEMFGRLSRELAPARVALLHGRMKEEDKEAAMAAFRDGRVAALVSTVVVEVGIDVPNATVMVIGHAERFGLSQLHQLRGRIGRGGTESYCILLARPQSVEARRRLQVMLDTTDGFKVAEEDLAIRGPGELLGTRQSGLPEFRAASFPADLPLLGAARSEAQELLSRDPELRSLEGTPLLSELRSLYGGVIIHV